MDSFFDENKQFEVLKEQYEEHGKLIVAYDFDDTVRPFRGSNCEQVIQLLKDLRPYAHLICFSARKPNETDMIKEYLESNDIPFDFINREWNGENIADNKMFYNQLLDDKAGLYESYRTLIKFLDWIKNERIT